MKSGKARGRKDFASTHTTRTSPSAIGAPARVMSCRKRIEARPSGSGRVGVLRWRWQLFNQRGEEVLDTEATSLFELS